MNGQRYILERVTPNKQRRCLFGLLNWVQNGVYTLRPSGVIDAMLPVQLIDRARGFEGNKHIKTVQELRAFLLNTSQ